MKRQPMIRRAARFGLVFALFGMGAAGTRPESGFFLSPITALRQNAPAALHVCYEIELGRIEETYRILDSLAKDIWPNWTGYEDVAFQVQFPDRSYLLINPRPDSPKGFEPVPGRFLRGRAVFLNRKDAVPFDLQPPLTGGGGGSRGVRIRLRARTVEPGREKVHNSDGQILLYIHELFHSLQKNSWKRDPRAHEGANGAPPAHPVRAAWSQIAGRELLRAYREMDQGKTVDIVRRFLAARRMALGTLDAPTAAFERHMTTAEGTATYANIMAAAAIRDKGYRPVLNRDLDPYFFGFQDMDGAIRRETEEALAGLEKNPFDALGFHYTGGAVMGLLLDRLSPGWKTGFFENGGLLEPVLEKAAGFDPSRLEETVRVLAAGHKLDDLAAGYEKLLRERDAAVRLVADRKGKKFVLDGSALKELFDFQARGREIRIDAAIYFPQGLEKMSLGEIEFAGAETPMARTDLHVFEWVATDLSGGAKGYELIFGRREGETYFDAVVKTSGFTLRAPEIRLEESRNTVRIILLAKVRKTAAESAAAAEPPIPAP